MKDGIKGWKKAGYPVVSQQQQLDALIAVNSLDFASMVVSEADAVKLDNATFVDFRDKAAFDKAHVSGANHVVYAEMFTKPMMEELNKSNSLVIIHDVPQTAGVIAATLKMMDYPSIYILK